MKWLKRIGLGLGALVVLVLLAGLSYEQWSRMSAARAFPPLGELVDVHGRQTHLYCTGEGSPTVILEAGLSMSGSLDWVAVQPEIARTTRVCSYDRAGIMWSDPGQSPRDAHRIADDLHALLGAAGVSPPYVLVGHSLGGLFIRVYDARHPDEVAGFVFVDSSHPEQMDRIPEEIGALMAPPSMPPTLASLLTALGVMRMMGFVTGDLLPEHARPPARAHGPRSLIGANAEILSLETSAFQTAVTGSLGVRPVVVLSATDRSPPPGFEVSEAAQTELVAVFDELQDEIAGLSTNSERRMIESAHYIQIEAPEAVIAAVRDVVEAVREPFVDGTGGA